MVILALSSVLPLQPGLRGSMMGKGGRRRGHPLSTSLNSINARIRRVCRDFNIRTVFKSRPTFCSLLTKVKDPLPMEKQANFIYKVPCTCGKVYIGETTISLETHLKKHKDTYTKGFMDKPTIVLNMPGQRTTPSTGMTLG